MLRAFTPRFLIPLALFAALAACSRVDPLLIVNLSAQPAHVRIAYPLAGPEGQPKRCGSDLGVMRMRPYQDHDGSDFKNVSFTRYDPDTCEMEFDLPTGYQVMVAMNEACDDSVDELQKMGAAPRSPKWLRIDGDAGSIELSGWQLARQFKRQRDDTCQLVYL